MKNGISLLLFFAITNLVIGQDTLRYDNGYWSTGGEVYIYDKKVSKADFKTFKCIDAEYSKDKKYVYFQERLMKGIDISSFEVLKYGYSKDKNNVYYNYYSGKTIEGADPSTFEVFDLSITKDKKHVYYLKNLEKAVKIKNVDAKTFRKYCNFFRDKNNLYNCIGEVLVNIRNSGEQYIREIAFCQE